MEKVNNICEKCPHNKEFKPCPLVLANIKEACKIYKEKVENALLLKKKDVY